MSILATAHFAVSEESASPSPTPEKVVIEHAEKANPEQDCATAVAAGDFRFLVVKDKSAPEDWPGVPRYAVPVAQAKGSKVLEAHCDVDLSDWVCARHYACRYNLYLLKQIPGADQPPKGYGTDKNLQGRNLARYDIAGSCVADPVHVPDSYCDFPRLRIFVSRHLRERKRGYLRVSYCSVDYCRTAYIFIEPAKSGAWNIAWRWVSPGRLIGPDDRMTPGHVEDLPPIVSLARVKHQPSDNPGGSYVLSFRSAEGTEVARL